MVAMVLPPVGPGPCQQDRGVHRQNQSVIHIRNGYPQPTAAGLTGARHTCEGRHALPGRARPVTASGIPATVTASQPLASSAGHNRTGNGRSTRISSSPAALATSTYRPSTNSHTSSDGTSRSNIQYDATPDSS